MLLLWLSFQIRIIISFQVILILDWFISTFKLFVHKILAITITIAIRGE
jgi:hypothetical protein